MVVAGQRLLSLFPDLPTQVVKAFAAVQFELSVERLPVSMSRLWLPKRMRSSPN